MTTSQGGLSIKENYVYEPTAHSKMYNKNVGCAYSYLFMLPSYTINCLPLEKKYHFFPSSKTKSLA